MSEFYITDALQGDIKKIKELDDLAFAGHQGISTDELGNIIGAGAILLLCTTKEDKIVGESQIVLRQFDGCPEFPDNLAYCFGTGLHPDYQGKGLGGCLAKAQERYAKESRREGLFLTARPENYASVSMRLRQGFMIDGYFPTYYGDNPEIDARISMTKMFETEAAYSPDDTVLVPVDFGDGFDCNAHALLQNFLSTNYIGTGISKEGITLARRIY